MGNQMSYLERLPNVEHEKTGTLATDRQKPFCQFCQFPGCPFSQGR
jgi:hypothetical protein